MPQSESSSSNSNSSSSYGSTVPSVNHGIKLKKLVQTKFTTNNVDGFRMRIEAYSANLMSNSIFRYIRGPVNSQAIQIDEFDGVCSPSDLEEFNQDSPAQGANPAWFRKNYVDLVFRSQHAAKDAWNLIVSDVRILVSTLDIMDTIVQEEVIGIGDPL